MTDGKVNEKIGHVFQQIIYLFTCKELKLEKIPLNALSVGRAVKFSMSTSGTSGKERTIGRL